jgi:NCS1 family nucleobase:cation symporter-1
MDSNPLSAPCPSPQRPADSGAAPQPGPHPLSPRLHNADLAPARIEGRRWGAYSLFALWTNDVHNMANYTFAIGLFAMGMSAGQILAAMALGATLVYLLMNLSGYMGQRTGVPFPVISRVSFGIRGAQLPAIIRAVIAIAWFGIQTYLASLVLHVLLVAVAPELTRFDHGGLLGLSGLGWVCFLAIWLVQLAILAYGMEMVRKFEGCAGPVILVTVLALAIWMVSRVDGHIAWSTGAAPTGLAAWNSVFSAAALWLAIYGTLLLNFCDFARSAPSAQSIRRGNFWGLPVNILVFAAISVLLAGAQFSIDGRVITSPADIVAAIPDKVFLVLGCLALLIVTLAVNIMANFVAPAFVLTNLAPRYLTFHRAGLISATLAVLILPWKIYGNPVVIVYFLSGLGALLGPLYGIIMADYWLIRKTRVHVSDLYTEAATGTYFYVRGVNPRALIALAPSATLAIVIALAPGLEPVAPYSWFLGAAVSGGLYWLISDRRRIHVHDAGEHLAVDSGRH